ncbi:predicted protein [Histoplasma capsulatum var. duboisii H88]|uniref:Predicted protein n=1 Tax=Ajellomyces capsulatus (strain H88) TaxID=544711 RepID=F0UN32_AJEC8|nr:predicted protein [Histoplasma capsulatum var. duboisii H88]QSS53671.1 hypothetical protein I7I53_00997 [Histoplasma capsulatum var. duboisii H88]
MAGEPPRRKRNQPDADIKAKQYAEFEDWAMANIEKFHMQTCLCSNKCTEILERIQLKEVAIHDATRVAEGTQDGHLLSQIEKEKKELADLYRDTQKYRNDLEKARKRCGQLKLMLESGLRELRPRFITKTRSTRGPDTENTNRSPAKRARHDTRSNPN